MDHFARAMLLATFIFASTTDTSTQTAQNLLPGLGSEIQRLRFQTGRVVNNMPEISPTLPDIPGPASPWSVTQWSQTELLEADRMVTDDPATDDQRLGVANYAFTASDGHSHVWIYREPDTHQAVYELYERDGPLSAAGGANIFLSRDAPQGGISLDHSIAYRLKARIAKARVDASPAATERGVVLAQVFTGFVIQFPEPDGSGLSTLFLQVPISVSRQPVNEYRSCTENSGRRTIIFDGNLRNDPLLPFHSDDGPLRPLAFDLSDYICALLSSATSCRDQSGELHDWSPPPGQLSFQDWKITSIYVGLETQNRDARPDATSPLPQGHVEVGLQLTDLELVADPGKPLDAAVCRR